MAAQESCEWRGMNGKHILTRLAHFNGQTTAKVLGLTLFIPERKNIKSLWLLSDGHWAVAIPSPCNLM